MARTYEVQEGDIFLGRGGGFFKVTRITEPTNPAHSGEVFHLEVFRSDRKIWSPTAPVHAEYGDEWNVLSPKACEMAGFTV